MKRLAIVLLGAVVSLLLVWGSSPLMPEPRASAYPGYPTQPSGNFNGAGSLTLPSGASLIFTPPGTISNSSQGATNTTGILVNPNVADGATSSGVDFKNSTATTSAQLVRFLRSGGTVSGQIELDTILAGSCVFRQPNTTYIAMLDSSNNGIKVTGGLSTLRAGGGDIVTVDSTSVYPNTGSTIDFGKPANRVRRLYVGGTALSGTNFALSAGWGASATVGSISASDDGGTFVVTAAGTTGANPTITVTFTNGTWTNVPNCFSKIEATTDAAAALTNAITDTPTATTEVITYNATPLNTSTYTFRFFCQGM